MSKPVVFVSYSHDDEKEKDALVKHLDVLKLYFDVWVDDKIWGGDDWEEKINGAMGKADIAIMLISANFLTSEFIGAVEIPTFLERRQNGGMRIFPIIAKHCAWKKVRWLQQLNVRPKNGTPIWRDGDRFADEELAKIAEEIEFLVGGKKEWPIFQNRKEELNILTDNLSNSGGDHFFLLVSGPQMGKTWLLNELQRKMKTSWQVLRIDLQSMEYNEVLGDEVELLLTYFSSLKKDGDLVGNISRFIVKENKPYLLLLDHVELLSNDVSVPLRNLLSEIHARIERAGSLKNHLAFVATSCSEIDAWKGIVPSPAFHNLVLTHFKKQVIEQALNEMAEIDGHNSLGRLWFPEMAATLDDETEGLPKLLMDYMQAIRDDGYMSQHEDIRSEEMYKRFAKPYVEKHLLTCNSLLLGEHDENNLKFILIKKALLRLSPYRWITESHLKNILTVQNDKQDVEFKSTLAQIKWTNRELWNALSSTYLIRPSKTLSYEMYPGIRRLLFRYQYHNCRQQASAHTDASILLRVWLGGLFGTDRVQYFVEYLWHLVEARRLVEDVRADEVLLEVQPVLESTLQPNHSTVGDLAKFMKKRLDDDMEMQLSMDGIDNGLFVKIIKKIDKIDSAMSLNRL